MQIQKYMSRISGSLLDRIDIHIEVPAVKFKDLSSVAKGEKSAEIRKRVVAARKIQLDRFKGLKGMHNNSDMGSKEIKTYCEIVTALTKTIEIQKEIDELYEGVEN
jgi:magnesium chelatase family protein